MRAHRTLIVSLVVGLLMAVPATASAKRLIIDGSTSMLPLVQKLATAYHTATEGPRAESRRRSVLDRHQRRGGRPR